MEQELEQKFKKLLRRLEIKKNYILNNKIAKKDSNVKIKAETYAEVIKEIEKFMEEQD